MVHIESNNIPENIKSSFQGKYEIFSLISNGGTASVYHAKSIQNDDEVALKILLSHLSSDQENVKRFLRYPQKIGIMSSEYLEEVIDYGQHNGFCYIALKYYSGGTLYEKIRNKKTPMNNSEIVNIMGPICEALTIAHSNNIIHRDLKSNNILFNQYDSPVLIDFGIAKFMDENDFKTRVGEVWGQPQYMSPEQINGNTVDTRSDIYSLGIIIYEMSTGGHLPYMGNDIIAIANKVANESPPPPSRYNHTINKSLENIILKTLSKLPAQRFQSVEELMEALETVKKGFSFNLSIVKKQPLDLIHYAIIGCATLAIIIITIIIFSNNNVIIENYQVDNKFIPPPELPQISTIPQRLNYFVINKTMDYAIEYLKAEGILYNFTKIIDPKKIDNNYVLKYDYNDKNKLVTLVISKKGFPMPDLRSLTLADARHILKANNLVEGDIVRIPGTFGIIENTLPIPGKFIYEEDVIKLVVGQ